MKLSAHFTLAEATESSTALRLGIDNTPNAEQLRGIQVAAEGMEDVRSTLGHCPISINSWLRVEELEKILTAKDFVRWCHARAIPVNDKTWTIYFQTKAHPKGFAVDFTCAQYGPPSQIARTIQASGIKFDQLIMEGSWVHISFALALRQQVLMATFKNGVPTYTQGVA